MQYDKGNDYAVIDAFEVSPMNASVLDANDRLVRHFPGRSIKIPLETLNKRPFQEYLAKELARFCEFQVEEMIPVTYKAGHSVSEIRDTTHPGLVTENLMNQLLAIGSHNDCIAFSKHTHDEVNWHYSKLPWVRSPFWLLLRVSLQMVLRRTFGPQQAQAQYKNFGLYLAVKIGETALELAESTPEILSLINTKVARRISKLQDEVFGFTSSSALALVSRTNQKLDSMRSSIREACVSRFPVTATDKDISISLAGSRDYLDKALSPPSAAPPKPWTPACGIPRHQFDKYTLPTVREDDDLLALVDFEDWVEHHLDNWVSITPPSDFHLRKLLELAKAYFHAGIVEYNSSLREKSLMFLVMMELWVAMDRMCVSIYPLLKEYSPPIPDEFLEPLLLPQFQQMRRASSVENYLRQRRMEACQRKPDIWSSNLRDSFAVCFFDSSQKLQTLRETIENCAETQKAERIREWELKSAQYFELLAKAGKLTHEFYYPAVRQKHHLPSCQRCRLEKQAEKLQIKVHEWPLSRDETMLKATIFELDCPKGFTYWRDISWMLVQDLGRDWTEEGKEIEHHLFEYTELRPFGVSHGQRLCLGSTTKSWLRTHFAGDKKNGEGFLRFPVAVDQVCFNNALTLELIDRWNAVWVKDQVSPPALKFNLTPKISSDCYSTLEWTAASYSHSQNEVLAKQVNCHSELSLDEFIAFGSLRAGERTQWYNIARELATPNMSLNEDSVSILLRHATSELGSPSPDSPRRLAHQVFEDCNFCNRLIETLARSLESIKTNWREQETLATLVDLILRTLTLAEDSRVINGAIKLLRSARTVAFNWCEELLGLLESNDGVDDGNPSDRIIRAATTCQETYNVEHAYMDRLLVNSSDVELLIRSSILVHERVPGTPMNSLATNIREPLLRGRKVLCKVERRLCQLICNDPLGIDSAIQRSMEGVTLDGPWETVDEGSGMVRKWTQEATQKRQVIEYDLLSGSLLIDGHPPGRLPASYTQSELYRSLFEQVKPMTLTQQGDHKD